MTITLPNAIINAIDFNSFSITQKTLHIYDHDHKISIMTTKF